MSVVQNTLIGRARQKIGGSVFSSWKGINVLKSKPLTVANPRTDAQQVQRDALKILTAFYRQVSGAIQVGFKQQAIQKSEFNAFTSYNLKNAIDKSGAPTAALVLTQMLVAQGTMATTPTLTGVASAGTGEVEITFGTALTGPGQSANDKAFLVVYNGTTETAYTGASDGIRSDGSVSLELPAGSFVSGNTLTCWLFFQSGTGVKTSDSVRRNVVAGA
jgi:hypothetical protein